MRLGVGRIQHHLDGRAASGRERLDDAPPQTLHRPADMAIVQRLWRTVLARCVPPGATRAQTMHDAADHTPVVHPRLAACIPRLRTH
jgi:hypothetical protein